MILEPWMNQVTRVLADNVNALRMPHYERRLLVAQRMKDARQDSGLTQRDIAQYLHIGQATYCRMEKAETEPSAVQLATLSGLYGLSVLWLLGMPNFVVNAARHQSSSSSSSRNSRN
jgi:DNA-binding XRE family transcriptional regulator